jgi:hypothetical protein
MSNDATTEEIRQAEIEAWETIYRSAISQAKVAARELQRRGRKLSNPVIVKKEGLGLTRTEIIVTIS